MKAIVIAPRGKMGKFITQIIAKSDDELIAGVAPKGRDYIGDDLGAVAFVGRTLKVPVIDNLEDKIDDCDVVIDFSTRENSLKVLDNCIKHKKALVCGTTGFSEEEMDRFKTGSKSIPILYAANTSKAVNVMNKVLKFITEKIGSEADIEILEMHDNKKIDAPSGTSLEMGEILAKARGQKLNDIARFGRHGALPREEGTIGYHSLRAGNIASSHTVFFGFEGERLEITHHSYSYECFASGAVTCGRFLINQKPGLYNVSDALNL
ncbi:MAG: 4-hydroxy-tetrahydrodipicolinate reductase [Lachnospiraceae bacterium]|nr:4-hydroxy-tetrahydrodipicolinate reductase [Lachnospiraceae bacterium]